MVLLLIERVKKEEEFIYFIVFFFELDVLRIRVRYFRYNSYIDKRMNFFDDFF